MSKNSIYDDLFNDDLVVDTTEPEKTTKKSEKKKVDTTVEKVVTTKKQNLSDSTTEIQGKKTLEIDDLWRVLCDLRGQFGVNQLLALLTKTLEKDVHSLSNKKTGFKRTPAAEAIKTLYRKLMSEGYI